MGNFCGNCGARHSSGAKFCRFCGAALESAQRSAAPIQSGAIPSPKPVRPSRKKGVIAVLALIVVAALGIGLLPGLFGDREMKPVTVMREPEPLAAQAASEATAIALRQYIYARLASEAFATADLEAISVVEIRALVEAAAQAWEDAALSAYVAEDITAQAIEVLDTPAIRQTAASGLPQARFLTLAAAPADVHTAALSAGGGRQTDPQTWAESLTKQYDALKGAKRYQQLAQQLGTDARTAYEQMALAQKIIRNKAELEETHAVAEILDSKVKYLEWVKSQCKTGMFIAATLYSGGGTIAGMGAKTWSALETGSVIIGGVDCIVDISENTSNIILGEDHQVTLTLNEAKEYLAPVSSIVGLVTFKSLMENPEKAVYIADSLVDLFYEDKIIGIKVEGLSGQAVSISGKVFESGAKAALKDAGYVWPENEQIKGLADALQDWKPDWELMIARLDALSAQMAAIYQNPELYRDTDESGFETIPEDELEEWENALEERENEGGVAQPVPVSGNGISGTYSCDISGPVLSGTYHITLQDNGDGTVIVSNFTLDTFLNPEYTGEVYEGRYNLETGLFFFDWFEAFFAFDGVDITATGEFYVEGEKHTVSLSRTSN